MNAREDAERELDSIDAELARWLVFDGTLSEEPLGVPPDESWRLELRERRIKAVERLEAAGGQDPHPSFLKKPTDAQRQAYEQRRRI